MWRGGARIACGAFPELAPEDARVRESDREKWGAGFRLPRRPVSRPPQEDICDRRSTEVRLRADGMADVEPSVIVSARRMTTDVLEPIEAGIRRQGRDHRCDGRQPDRARFSFYCPPGTPEFDRRGTWPRWKGGHSIPS